MSRPAPLEPSPPWAGSRVVLGVSGGIAAYKAVQVARDLTRLGAQVDTVLTRAATRFVAPLSFEGVTGRPVLQKMLVRGGAASHIGLGRDADVVCVAPATADLLARAAHGRADDLLATTLLVTRAPVVLCPAMNDRMYAHPQTQQNLRHLAELHGHVIAGPGVGPLAAGEGEGPGRMLEPEEIVEHVGRALGRRPDWDGKKVVITAGPTREAVDPVRFLGNRSSGKMADAIARAAWRRGAEVTIVSGPTALPPPVGVEVVRVEDARDMSATVTPLLVDADVLVFAAAVSDFRPASPSDTKVKSSEVGAEWAIDLVANPDIAKESSSARKAGSVAVGFALETDDLLENAGRKRREKGFDLIVANPAGEPGVGIGADFNRAVLLGEEGPPESLPVQSKAALAEEILDRVEAIATWS